MILKYSIGFVCLLLACTNDTQYNEGIAAASDYLGNIKNEFVKECPNNRTINLVFHGHSVPAGYFVTPTVNTFDSYPFQVLKQLKSRYPFAVINVINTAIAGETSKSGQKRLEGDVLNHKPDVLFIDYALNDRLIGLGAAKKAWEKMIEQAKQDGIKIILLTPSPDLAVNLLEKDNVLEKHSNQIIALAKKYHVGLVDSYSLFKKIKADCNCLADYMSQGNHPNAKGHSIIAEEIMNYFIQ